MSPVKVAHIVFLAGGLTVACLAAMNVPRIGAGARFQSQEVGPGWHRGFFNQIRTVPACYILVTFNQRSSPDASLRVKRMIPIARVRRLQVTDAPGTSMQEWDGLGLPAVSESSWQEIELDSVRPIEGQCQFDESFGQ